MKYVNGEVCMFLRGENSTKDWEMSFEKSKENLKTFVGYVPNFKPAITGIEVIESDLKIKVSFSCHPNDVDEIGHSVLSSFEDGDWELFIRASLSVPLMDIDKIILSPNPDMV